MTLLKVKRVTKQQMLLVQTVKLLRDHLMQLKEGEITIASGFMDAVLIPAQEMAVNLQEMVVQVVTRKKLKMK